MESLYDPFDYYNSASYSYSYQRRQAVPTRRRRSMGIFAGAKPAATKPSRRERDMETSFWIPVNGRDSDPEPKRKAAPTMSTEQAAVRMQVAARGLLTRKSVRAVREVEREAMKMASEVEVSLLAADLRARASVGEALMRMLLRLDAVRRARDYRRRITKWVLALQDVVDALETTVAPEIPDATERGSEMDSVKTAVHLPTQMEFDGTVAAAAEPEAGEEKEEVPNDANVDVDEPEWEMVTEENEHAEPTCPLEKTIIASAGAVSDGVDVTKVMEMVAALCEQSTEQCTVIGALAERVDALERTVRRMEDAGSHRRRAKKLSTEGK